MPGAAPELVHPGLRAQHRPHPAHVRGPQLPALDLAAREGRGGTLTVHRCLPAAPGNCCHTGPRSLWVLGLGAPSALASGWHRN